MLLLISLGTFAYLMFDARQTILELNILKPLTVIKYSLQFNIHRLVDMLLIFATYFQWYHAVSITFCHWQRFDVHKIIFITFILDCTNSHP